MQLSPGLETIKRLKKEGELVINGRGDSEFINARGKSVILDDSLRSVALVHLARAVNEVVDVEIEKNIDAGVRAAVGILASVQDRIRAEPRILRV